RTAPQGRNETRWRSCRSLRSAISDPTPRSTRKIASAQYAASPAVEATVIARDPTRSTTRPLLGPHQSSLGRLGLPDDARANVCVTVVEHSDLTGGNRLYRLLLYQDGNPVGSPDRRPRPPHTTLD